MPAAPSPSNDAEGADPSEIPNRGGTTGVSANLEHERAADALRAAFTRLAPQGSDAWNFLAAFTHLGDRYGPYQPGASTLSGARHGPDVAPHQGRTGRLGWLRAGRERRAKTPLEAPELEEAMGHVVEAFRFLSARVATLEERLAYEDRPVDGAAWLVPARELGGWVKPIASYLLEHSPGGSIVHADCGEGALLHALADGGAEALGVEPRGGVALRALEGGCAVTIGEASGRFASWASGSLGGVVLSGVVDRLPLHAMLPLLAQCRRTMALGAPLVVVLESPLTVKQREPAARDVAWRPLHRETWELVLVRSGFVDIAPVFGTGEADGRLALSAATPA